MSIYPKEHLDRTGDQAGQGGCFVIMPLARDFDEVYHAIHSACTGPDLSLSCIRADDVFRAGKIMEDILDGIVRSEFIIADVTGKNPNVFYELGIAHCCKAPANVIILTQNKADVPFDLQHLRYVPYSPDSPGLRKLHHELIRTLQGSASALVKSQATFHVQSKLLRKLHHVSVPVRDLQESLRFYRDDLELEVLPTRPRFPFPGEWLALPSGQEIHLVYNPAGTFRNSKEINPRDTHFAIQVKDWRRANQLLLEKNIKSLLDPYQLCLLQTYILDPNDHVIEINALGVPDLQ